MVRFIYFQFFLFALPFGVLGQNKELSLQKDSITVSIYFVKDDENPNYYHLNCETNSDDLFGTINFYDKKGRNILQLLEIEIAHVPGYHVIDTVLFPTGEITIELFVDDKPYKKTIRL